METIIDSKEWLTFVIPYFPCQPFLMTNKSVKSIPNI